MPNNSQFNLLELVELEHFLMVQLILVPLEHLLLLLIMVQLMFDQGMQELVQLTLEQLQN